MVLYDVRIFPGCAESKKCTSWQGWVEDQGCPLHGGFHSHGSNRSELTNVNFHLTMLMDVLKIKQS